MTCGVGLYHHVVGTWLHTILSIDKMDDRLLSDKIIPNWLAKPKKIKNPFRTGRTEVISVLLSHLMPPAVLRSTTKTELTI